MFNKSLILLFSLSSFSVLAAPPKAVDIFQTVNERLGYMEDVALYKALNHKAIEDIPREQVVIKKAAESAQQYQLVPETVARFTEAQIRVAKAIQYRYRADLLSQPSSRTPRDLKAVIRPALITLNNKLNKELSELLSTGQSISKEDWPAFQTALTNAYVSASDKRMLFESISHVRHTD